MKNITILFFLTLFSWQVKGQSDSIKTNNNSFKSEVNNLKHEIEILKRDQLNYQIEKDLLKDAYSNNYDKLNLFITGILLLFGFFGVLGIRDINSIKKEHKDELEKLKSLQVDLESKSKDFPITAIASILHRVSGVITFVAVGILLWLLSISHQQQRRM